MTDEELRKEATSTTEWKNTQMIDRPLFVHAYITGARPREKRIEELEKENTILKKALNLYVNWADECGIAWDNFPDMTEKWYKVVEEKGLGWIEGLTFMAIEEAKEQLKEAAK